MKKMIRRVTTLVLAVLMVLSLCAPAFAADGSEFFSNSATVTTSVRSEELPDATAKLTFSKVFEGISRAAVEELADFKVTIDDKDYTRDMAKISEDGLTWTWETDLAPGDHKVTESNEVLENWDYKLVSQTGVGESVTVNPPVFEITNIVEDVKQGEGNREFQVSISAAGVNFFAAISTGFETALVVVPDTMSHTEMQSIEAAILKFYDKAKMKVEFKEIGPSTPDGAVFTAPDMKLTYHKDKGTVTFEGTKNWTRVLKIGYTSEQASVPDHLITNTYEALPIDIPGTKTWVGDRATDRPKDGINVNLLANGESVATKTVTAADADVEKDNIWNFVFEDMPRFGDDGERIVYTVEEEVPDGYKASYDDSHLNITNELDKTDVGIQKIVSGSMGDVKKSFNFQVVCDNPVEEDRAYTVEVKDGKYYVTFSLTNGASVTLKGVKIGSQLTISETNAQGYKMYIGETVAEGQEIENGTYEYNVTKNDDAIDVIVNNNKEGTPDTGVILDSLPYVLILAVVAAGAVVFLRKRRSRDED